jgi:hypothetical protein
MSWIAQALLAFALCALGGCQDGRPAVTSSPTPAQAFAEFFAHFEGQTAAAKNLFGRTGVNLQSGMSRASEDGKAIVAMADQERAWLDTHVAAPCYQAAHAGWRSEVQAFGELGGVVASLPGLEANDREPRLVAALSLYSSRLLSPEILEAARQDCNRP